MRAPAPVDGSAAGPAPRLVPGAAGTASTSSSLRRLMRSKVAESTLIRLPRRQVLYGCYGGSHTDSNLYLVEKGYVKLVTPSRDGKECLLGIFTEGDIVGEQCLGDTERCESAMTMTRAVVRRMPRSRLLRILDNPGVREEFVRYLAQRLVEQQQLITDFVTADSEHRFAAILLHLARKLGEPNSNLLVINARITQEEFAAMVGTTRSRIGLFLKHFVSSGAVLRGWHGVLAVDQARLEALLTTD